MDQRYLVDSQIDEGLEIANVLVAAGVDLVAAFWSYSEDVGRWTLCMVLASTDMNARVEFSRRLSDAMPEDEDSWVSWLDVSVLGETEPIARLALDIQKKHPGPKATHSRRKSLRDLGVDEVYVYPLIESPPRASSPNVKVTGLMKVTEGVTATEVVG